MTKFPNTQKLGHVYDQVSFYTTKFKTKKIKKRPYETLIKKKFLEDPAFFLICFCTKDGTSSSKTVGGDRFFVSF